MFILNSLYNCFCHMQVGTKNSLERIGLQLTNTYGIYNQIHDSDININCHKECYRAVSLPPHKLCVWLLFAN